MGPDQGTKQCYFPQERLRRGGGEEGETKEKSKIFCYEVWYRVTAGGGLEECGL